MAFIKIEDVVINTSYIAAVRLECHTNSSADSVSLLVAIPNPSSLQQETSAQGLYHYEWLEFTGDAARALQDYFSSFNNVTDLLPQYDSPVCCSNSQLRWGDRPF